MAALRHRPCNVSLWPRSASVIFVRGRTSCCSRPGTARLSGAFGSQVGVME